MSHPARAYTAILIAQPELGEEALTRLQTQFKDGVTRHGGSVLESQVLGKRRLNYRIGRFQEGIYLQAKLQIPPEEVIGLRKTASLLESLVRLMVIRESLGTPAGVLSPETS